MRDLGSWPPSPSRLPGGPWAYVLLAAAAMGAAGTYQFVWSSLRPALATQVGADEATLGTVFTVYVIGQTVSQFPAGRVRDRRGPRLPGAIGSVLLATGYLGTGLATEPWQALVAYAVGGVGAGTVYTVAVNTPVKWIEERRGLATGVVTMAYGGVSVLFIPYVRTGLAADFFGTLAVVAAATGGAALLATLVLQDPELAADGSGETPEEERTGGASDDEPPAYGWRETVRTWQFWVLYAMMVAVNAVGLMVIGKAVDFAGQYGFAASVVTAVASVVALSDSAGIVTLGGLSDRLGRERTLAATIVLSGVAVAASVPVGENRLAIPFLLAVGGAAFFRSPAFSIGPAIVGEYYGRARSSENYALLYTSKVWGGVGGGVVASLLIASVGWSTAFLLGGGALVLAGMLTTLLRPVDRSTS